MTTTHAPPDELGARRAARDREVRRRMPLARRVARRYDRGSEPREDLEQVAYIGLIKAIDRFDPDHGTPFVAFAIPTIAGELRRHFRDNTWKLHVPRDTKQTALDIARHGDALQQRNGRPATVSELAQHTQIQSDRICEALCARAAQSTMSLDRSRAGDDGDMPLGDCVGGEDPRLELAEDLATIRPRMRRLPKRQRRVLFLRFVQDLTQREIAGRVGCSQMQVSRLLRTALEQLRTPHPAC